MDTLTIVKLITKLLPMLAAIISVIKEAMSSGETSQVAHKALDVLQNHVEQATKEITATCAPETPPHDGK